ncbi:MAG TPA: DNA-protecting protein DprA, partial [Lachnospiraceae bacterium]|nr:DNA-protecting protein DprA [Lachnospiraceae bacterium]
MEQERTLALALCRVEGIGAVSIRKLLEKAGDVSEIRKLPAESLQKLLGEKKAALLKNWDAPENLEQAKRQEEQWKKKGISFDFLWEEAYPKRLKEISDPPLVLYRIGKLPEPEKKMAAIVGARACSSYGKEMAEYFARGLAKEGIGIVSGMARGADGIAQRAALSAGGYSVAVLGCGVDICYPEENRPLYERLWENGCILSEYPPGTLPHSRLFPPRNRI